MKKHSFKRILFKCSAALILTFITACLIFAAVFYGATKDVKLDDSKILSPSFTSLQMSDVNGSPIKPSRGAYTPYADIPKNLVNAFVAAEDKRFFEHNGIDIARIIGALKNNIKAGSLKEGASTIDQQLIKNTHLSNEKTFERKVKEIKLALELDRGYSKERIVEAYLNGLYFGCGVYGVTSAAEVFFDKTLTELTVCECAALAAVIKNPYGYSPFNNLKRLYERRDVVLSLMRKNGYIDARQEADALLERLIISDKKPFIDACDSYAECVLEEASKITGLSAKELRLSKYTIRTYYNPDAEKILADAVNNPDYLLKNKNGKTPDAFALLVDNHDGGISAFYINSYIASIYGLRRQPGSIAKPLFVYAPAFKYGIVTPSTVIDDTAREFDGYSPGNYKNKYLGQITVRQAVKYSSNIAAVDVLSRLTVERAKHFADEMNIRLSSRDGLNIALGGLTYGLNPVEIAGGYAMLANDGNYNDIGFIREIYDESGNLVYQKNSTYKKIMTDESAYMMTDILKETSKSGTTKFLSELPFDTASKSGTVSHPSSSSLNNDAWNASYTSCHTLISWQGNLSNSLDNALLSGVTGGGYPTLVAREILSKLYEDGLPADF